MNQDSHIILDKELRRDIDAIIQRLKDASEVRASAQEKPLSEEEKCGPIIIVPVRRSRERSLAVTKLQEAVMWLGMDLKAINDESGGAENPYPNSKDPSNTKIEPTADGLKM